VGWHFDIGNAGRVGPAERWIQVIGKRILRIHVKDYSAKPADPAAGGNERPKLLEGDTNWPAVMKALDNAGYTGWAISEQPGNQAADLETARDLAQRMDRIFACDRGTRKTEVMMRVMPASSNVCFRTNYFSLGYFKIIPSDFPSSWRRTDSARWSMKRLISWAGRLKVLRHSPGEGWIGFQPTACSNLSRRSAD
jgi:hypothetical protein